MTYGLECALKCSECRNGTSCHHVNGTCTHGCADGLYGDMCQKGLNCQIHQIHPTETKVKCWTADIETIKFSSIFIFVCLLHVKVYLLCILKF